MELRPVCKQTDVGVIPEDWESRELQELGSWKGGATPSMQNKDFWVGGTIPWAASGDVKSISISDTELHVTESAVERTSTTLVPEESIIVVTRSGILRKYLPVATNRVQLAINQDLKALIPRSGIVSGFVLQSLVANGPRILATCLKSGTTVESIEFPWLKAYQIPVPPSPHEQAAIAAVLSDMDALIASLDRLIAKKRNIKQAAMQQLLTGKIRLPGFGGEPGYKNTEARVIPEDWDVGNLGDCLNQPPKYGINAPAAPYQDGLPVYIRITDITDDGRFSPEKISSVEACDTEGYFLSNGDLVFARTGASVGKSYLYDPKDGPMVFAGFLIKVRPSQSCLLPGFLAAYATTGHYWNWVAAMSTRSGQPGINGHEYCELPIPLPPVPEQRAIVEVLSHMRMEIAALEARRDKTMALKQGMVQELLTGRIRLI